jgi:hypothetical protein
VLKRFKMERRAGRKWYRRLFKSQVYLVIYTRESSHNFSEKPSVYGTYHSLTIRKLYQVLHLRHVISISLSSRWRKSVEVHAMR